MKYSRKQIQEAIKYWKDVLVQMNESKSLLIDRLEMAFGSDLVRSPKADFMFDLFNIFKIFDFLNENCFDGKLNQFADGQGRFNKYPIFNLADSNQEIIEDLKRFGIKSNKFFYGGYVAITKKTLHVFNVQSCDFIYEPLYINMSVGKMTFIYAVSLMAHEMIHMYDTHFDAFLKIKNLNPSKNDIEHNTPYFTNKSDQLNAVGLTIMKHGTNQIEMNKKAYDNLSALLEDETAIQTAYGNLIAALENGEKFDTIALGNNCIAWNLPS